MRASSFKLLKGVRFCSCCGARILLQGYNKQNRFAYIMEQKGICYDCAYWLSLAEYPPKYMEVLNNQCVTIHPFVDDCKDKSIILGGRGKKRWFVKPGVQLIMSNDVWIIGTPPERFKFQFKNSIYEITEKAYRQLRRNKRWCKARACMDRYNCYRFDLSLEDELGQYNKIPKKWRIGDEHCGYRLDPKEILTDDSSVKTLKLLANGKEN